MNRFDKVRANIDAGVYDSPEVIDATVDRVHEVLVNDSATLQRPRQAVRVEIPRVAHDLESLYDRAPAAVPAGAAFSAWCVVGPILTGVAGWVACLVWQAVR